MTRSRRRSDPIQFGGLRGRWKRAGLFGAVTAAVAVGAAFSAVANITRNENPALAARQPINDALAAANAADRQLRLDPGGINGANLAAVATRSLREQAINPVALRLLALSEEAAGKPERALALSRLSERLSRRDMLTQLILIEADVGADNASQALIHYDRALRTKLAARELLFPILRAALPDRNIRAALKPLIDSEHLWAEPFLRDSLSNGAKPALIADLVLAPKSDKSKAKISDAISDVLLVYLVTAKDYENARRYYLSLPDADGRLLQSAEFSSASTNRRRAPIAWQPSDNPDINVTFEQGKGAHLLTSPETRGIALSKLLFLAPGNYRTVDQRKTAAANGGAGATWRLTCLTGTGGVIWQGAGSQSLNIPRDCGAQMVEFLVSGGNDQGLELTIERFELVRQPG